MTSVDDLRRLDWRFLLDDARVRSIVGVDGVEHDVPTSLDAGDSEGEGKGEGSAVVFVRDPDAAAVSRALAIRDPHGVVVVETSTRRARRVVRGRLRRAGLHVAQHGAWPRCSTATRFVPLDRPAELAAAAHDAKNRRRRTAGIALTRLGLGPLLFRETTSIAVSVDRPGVPAPLRVAFGDGAGRHGTMTLLTPRFASSRHVIAMVTDGQGRPLVVKTPRRPDDDEQLTLEARGLSAIGEGGPARPLLVADTTRFGQRWLVQSRVNGPPLTRHHVVQDPERWSAAVHRWLSEMPAGELSAPDRDGRSEHLIRPALDLLSEWARREPELGVLVADATEALRIVGPTPIPTVVEHGDFRPPNLIITESDSIGAVDWELAERCGLPMHDLAYFDAYVLDIVPRLRPTLRRSAVTALDALGVEPALLDPLTSLASLRHLAHEAVRLGRGGPEPGNEVAATAMARAWLQRLQAHHDPEDTAS